MFQYYNNAISLIKRYRLNSIFFIYLKRIFLMTIDDAEKINIIMKEFVLGKGQMWSSEPKTASYFSMLC